MLCTDIQVKYGTLLEEGKSLDTSARQAIAYGAGAIVVTGRVTGEPPTLAAAVQEIGIPPAECWGAPQHLFILRASDGGSTFLTAGFASN